ncbi:hypothetical protein ABWH92_12420 [Ahrensia marina]|uniref:hypothetical protein n=1 Tax=Ahrensia marina TaxID=1514904 RepID=UPI0035CFE42B
MTFSVWSDLAAHIAQGNKVKVVHLCQVDLKEEPFRFWAGRYRLTAFGQTWEPTGSGDKSAIEFTSVSTDNEAYAQGSQIIISPQNYEFAKIVLGDYDDQALYRQITRYMAFMDDDWTPLFDQLIAIQAGILDKPSFKETQEGVQVTIPVEGALATQRLANLGWYTDYNHKLQYPTELGLEFMSRLSGTEVAWPIYG